eukprot:jgi/Chlat1/5957/Chrsp4S06292
MEEKGRWRAAAAAVLVVVLAVLAARVYLPANYRGWNKGDVHGGVDDSCSCQASFQLNGTVSDCCCDYATVDQLNEDVFKPVLSNLVTTPFFRYFKVNLWGDCHFFPDDAMCRMRDCSVEECPDEEVPSMWREPQEDDEACVAENPLGKADLFLDKTVFRGWRETDNPWTMENESCCETIYVNLRQNPERFTGYVGETARRVWDAIYHENCFFSNESDKDTCTEARVFHKLISGMHTSISIHIAGEYLLDEDKGLWGPHLQLYWDRVGQFTERQENLYFAFLFVTRAVTKAADYLAQASYDTGQQAEDARTLQLVKDLVHSTALQASCPLPFDEGTLWRGQDGPLLMEQLKARFQNITAIMDCVGCEKCRLWGKLQILGIATSLKILFSVENQPIPSLDLQRNEVIALLNFMHRLSESLALNARLLHMYHHKLSDTTLPAGMLDLVNTSNEDVASMPLTEDTVEAGVMGLIRKPTPTDLLQE